LEQRALAHEQKVSAEFVNMMAKLREEVTASVTDSVKQTTDYTKALSQGIFGLNNVLRDLGEKQVIVQQVKKKGWFSRNS